MKNIDEKEKTKGRIMLTRSRRKSPRKSAGAPPGTLLHIGPERTEQVSLEIIQYDEKGVTYTAGKNVEDLKKRVGVDFEAGTSEKNAPKAGFPEKITWVNVSGVHDPNIVRAIGEFSGMHPLFMEDVMDTFARPKVEISQDNFFLSMKMMRIVDDADANSRIVMEQVSLFLNKNLLITFQEAPGDVFEPVRKRIHTDGSMIRRRGADFLAYALTDVIVDQYFSVIEKMEEYIEPLEEQVISSPEPEQSGMIHQVRNDLIQVRRVVWPMREVVRALQRDSAEQCDAVSDDTRVFFGDVYDHVIQVMDQIETFRDILSGISDMYMNSISLRMNNIMKVLTLIATIFIPLTFIVGIYGMNFTYMPELEWRWGYFAVLLIMAAVAVGMIVFFKKKKWL